MEALVKLGAVILKAIIEIIKEESDEDLTDDEVKLRIFSEMERTKKDAQAIKDHTRAIAEGREP